MAACEPAAVVEVGGRVVLAAIDGRRGCSARCFVVFVSVLAGASLEAQLVLTLIIELSLQRSTSRWLLAGVVCLNIFGMPISRRCRLARLGTSFFRGDASLIRMASACTHLQAHGVVVASAITIELLRRTAVPVLAVCLIMAAVGIGRDRLPITNVIHVFLKSILDLAVVAFPVASLTMVLCLSLSLRILRVSVLAHVLGRSMVLLLILPMRVATFSAASRLVAIARPATLIFGGVEIILARLLGQVSSWLLLIAVIVLGATAHAGELNGGASMAVSRCLLLRHIQ